MVSTHESDKDHVKKVDCAMGKYAKGLDNVCQIILKTTGQECMWSTEDIGIVFITLKPTGHINWSWWYVTMPFWGGLAIFIAIVVMYLVILSIKEIFQR